MLLAYDFPLLGLFWTILWFYLIIAWLMILFSVIADIFRNHEMGGFAKALWLILVVWLPILGVIFYTLANGDGMAARHLERAKRDDDAFRSYVQTAAAPAGPADQLTQLAALHAQGSITDEEFAAGKAKILG
jgi:hypothetical protein